MNRRIYKYPFKLASEVNIVLPFEARPLTVQEQNGVLCLWALVDPAEEKMQPRRFRIFGTGHDIERVESMFYLTTLQMGALVWHVFLVE
jgi:hypothetical protein